MDESLLNVIKDNIKNLTISAKAVNLITLSEDKVARQKKQLEDAQQEIIAAKQLSTLGTALTAFQYRITNTFNMIIPNMHRLRSRVNLDDPDIAEILDIIERNSKYTARIMQRVQKPLNLSEMTDVNLNTIIRDTVLALKESLQSQSKNSLVSVDFHLDDRVPFISASSEQMREVFYNLLQNSYDVMPEGGNIEIQSKLVGRKIQIRIKDSGPGIATDIQERLFKKPVPNRYPVSGDGISLWLSNLILKTIGGSISVEKSDHTGTTMLVVIPTRT